MPYKQGWETLEINLMSWEAMEVSMSKTRRGKYTDNRICYISKCKGDMRLYLRRKGKLPCFSYLVRGKSFSFYRGKIRLFIETTKETHNYFNKFLNYDGMILLHCCPV